MQYKPSSTRGPSRSWDYDKGGRRRPHRGLKVKSHIHCMLASQLCKNSEGDVGDAGPCGHDLWAVHYSLSRFRASSDLSSARRFCSPVAFAFSEFAMAVYSSCCRPRLRVDLIWFVIVSLETCTPNGGCGRRRTLRRQIINDCRGFYQIVAAGTKIKACPKGLCGQSVLGDSVHVESAGRLATSSLRARSRRSSRSATRAGSVVARFCSS